MIRQSLGGPKACHKRRTSSQGAQEVRLARPQRATNDGSSKGDYPELDFLSQPCDTPIIELETRSWPLKNFCIN